VTACAQHVRSSRAEHELCIREMLAHPRTSIEMMMMMKMNLLISQTGSLTIN
jgi:hypothetical protein